MSSPFDRKPSCRAHVSDLTGSPASHKNLIRPVQIAPFESDHRSTLKPLNREQRLRETILLALSETASHRVEELLHFSRREWVTLFYWLDVSGLALYLLDRIAGLGLSDRLPSTVLERLQKNMEDNTERTRGMVEESVAVQREFQNADLSYAVMKGLSLYPASVARPELRHQFDLDYLISAKSAPEARKILERRGYRLYAISGKSWEFKINETPYVSIKDLYKNLPGRAVELHIEAETSGQSCRLDRIAKRDMFGITMPVFSPVDLFLGQGLHAFKDVCSSFSRAAHLLEFYRHVLTRREDDAFWHELRIAAGTDRRSSLGIGVVVAVITSVMGDFAPALLTTWTSEALPPSVRLWVDLYGRRTVFGKHPGTKLYLLLQRELEKAGVPGRRSIKKSLLPSRLPLAVIRPLSHETLTTRIARYRVQMRFIFSRLRFHLVEGLRYAVESYRWRRHLKRIRS